MVNMKIMIEDLVMIQGLATGPDDRYPQAELMAAAQRHRDFLLQNFSVWDQAGLRVKGVPMRIDTGEIPPEGARQEDLMALHVYYYWSFALNGKQNYLTFKQTFGGPDALLPAFMELIVFQNNVLLQPPVPLRQEIPYTLEFDWKSPPRKAARRWFEFQDQLKETSQKRLGITSYSGLYSFIYITAQEIRHEILIPLATLEKWLPLKRSDTDFLDVAEQQAARVSIEQFFLNRNPVFINGSMVKPVVSRLQFFGPDIRDFAANTTSRRVSMVRARLGIILTYATNTPPQSVKIIWDTFNTYAPVLRSVIYPGRKDVQKHQFNPDQKTFEWTHRGGIEHSAWMTVPSPERSETIPLPTAGILFSVLAGLIGWIGRRRRTNQRFIRSSMAVSLLMALVCLIGNIGAVTVRSPLSDAAPHGTNDADKVTEALLHNIYRAFDCRSESQVYDALAASVDGPLLNDIYLQIHKGLEMAEQGGAVSRVNAVRLMDHQVKRTAYAPDGSASITVACRWQVDGAVEHWGHVHTRMNECRALLTLSASTGNWKLTHYELLDETRLGSKIALRT